MKTCPRLLIPFLIPFFTLCAGLPAAAATLDAKAAKSLISDRVWQQKYQSGPTFNYWSWKSDGSVCLQLRTYDKTAKCTDTGRWKLEAERLCYELTWFGASQGRKAACFRIANQGEGRYEAISDNGLTFFEFSVVQ